MDCGPNSLPIRIRGRRTGEMARSSGVLIWSFNGRMPSSIIFQFKDGVGWTPRFNAGNYESSTIRETARCRLSTGWISRSNAVSVSGCWAQTAQEKPRRSRSWKVSWMGPLEMFESLAVAGAIRTTNCARGSAFLFRKRASRKSSRCLRPWFYSGVSTGWAAIPLPSCMISDLPRKARPGSASFRAASVSVLRSLAPWLGIRSCFFSMNRPPVSIRNPAGNFGRSFANWR